jgi:hypothetical protein
MRGAFVVQLGPETRPTEGQFEGWVEEVDSCTALRFRSSDELLKFLGQRFELVLASADKARAGNRSEQVPPRKKSARKKRGYAMNITRILLPRAFLLITLLILFVCLTYGTEGRPPVVHIVRNVAWNDFISQINFWPDGSPEDSLDKELLVVQKFLKAHETEVRVGVYDLEVFRAIDQARARLQKADRDLETLRKELSYKEAQAKLGR